MISIRQFAQHIQAQIDFRWCANGNFPHTLPLSKFFKYILSGEAKKSFFACKIDAPTIFKAVVIKLYVSIPIRGQGNVRGTNRVSG